MRQKVCYNIIVKICGNGIPQYIPTRERERSNVPFFVGKGAEMSDKTKKWIKAALIRAVKTVCQTAIATIGTAVYLNDVNWIAVVSASILAGILSILTSLAGLPEVKE